MTTVLEPWEIILWKDKQGKLWASTNDPMHVAQMAETGAKLLGDLNYLRYWASKELESRRQCAITDCPPERE